MRGRIGGEDMKKYYDRNNRLLTQGNTIDLNQTINGRRYLDVVSLDPLKIRYSKILSYDWTQSDNEEDYEFEYDPERILEGGMFGEVEWEIVFNNFGKTY